MPCCFKKDPLISKNKEKKDFFMKCIGKIQEEEEPGSKVIGDRLYILQDTNKIQEGRFGFLPKYLDFFFNQALEKTRKIKQHYLLLTKTGYFFKYGSRQQEYPFLNAFASIVDMNLSEIRDKLISKLEKDKSDMIFTSLNNGDIKTHFDTREKYINYLKTSRFLSFEMINHFISLPGVISSGGFNIIIFQKEIIVIKKTLEKEKHREDFTIICQNDEETNNLVDISRSNIFMIKEYKNYYPIVHVIKKDEASKSVNIQKQFEYEANKEENIINHILDFYNRNCKASFYSSISRRENILTAKKVFSILKKINNKDYLPKFQVIDARNKCKYLISSNSTIIPVKQSGSIYNLQILKHMDPKILPIKETIEKLNKLYTISNKSLPVKPIGIYYDTKNKGTVKVTAIMTVSYGIIPIKQEIVPIEWINKQGYVMENKPLYDKIDEEIEKGQENFIIDDRINKVRQSEFENETYQLFRLEFSDYINQENNDIIKRKIVRTIGNKDLRRKEKIGIIRSILYKLIDKALFNVYERMKGGMKEGMNGGMKGNIQDGGKYEKMVHIITKLPYVTDYIIDNNRTVCGIHGDKEECAKHPHCYWTYDNCYLAFTKKMAIKFVNQLSEELIHDDLKASELLQKGDYFVSDIVDYNRFTQRPGQKIIKSTNTAINKELENMFGKENIPKIGRRRRYAPQDVKYQEMNIENPLRDMGEYFVQKIIENNLTIYRGFANSYFWTKEHYYDLDSRNLGYFGKLQTNLANYFKSIVVDWLLDKDNRNIINKDVKLYLTEPVEEYVKKMTKDIIINTNCIIELYTLNKKYNVPILVHTENNDMLYVFDNEVSYNANRQGVEEFNDKKYNIYRNPDFNKNAINLRLSFLSGSDIPISVESIYYK